MSGALKAPEPDEALSMLEDLTGKLQLTRVDHERVKLCIAVLGRLVAKEVSDNGTPDKKDIPKKRLRGT